MRFSVHTIALLLAATAARADVLPANFTDLECAVAQFAAAYAASKLPASANASIVDALNVPYLCANVTSAPLIHPAIHTSIAREQGQHATSRAALGARLFNPAASVTLYIAPTGDDSNPGTLAQPFATLPHAAAVIRSMGPRAPGDTIVYVRAGTYYMGDNPLRLSEDDSNVTWAAYPPDAPAPVVLSGGINLGALNWRPWKGGVPGIQVAAVSISDPRREAWRAAHGGSTLGRAGPPPLVASLFINGVRQVRARYPNGNPQDNSGICFSATQRPGEGCAGWSSCVLAGTGMLPAPAGTSVSGFGPNRGDSPTLGCPQCGHCGTFGYNIYPPPLDHPVYNQPLPGVGWSNTSVFSFWGSPFSRPAGIQVNAASMNACDPHWAAVSYSNPTDAVVHMFHAALWGGWMYAVDNVTYTNTTEPPPPTHDDALAALLAAIPTDNILWLQADKITASDGQPLTAWADASPAGNDASQTNATQQPTYFAKGFANGLPTVRFYGNQWVGGNNLVLDVESTIYAVIRDNGTTTTYGGGVFFSLDGDNGLGTKAAVEQGPLTADDDAPPMGSNITALMMDWPGSPANPGHRNLYQKPAVISIVYTLANTYACIDGCEELSDSPNGMPGTGYMIGARNNEMGRFYTGDISEVIVYPRALNFTERAAVNTYLAAKWQLPHPPKDCAAPEPLHIMNINFGYGGYQEARGSGINVAQHFYIENVLEELDAPGEWFYDATAGQLYVYPNGTDLSTATLAVPLADSVVVVNGSQSGRGVYARNISFTGFTITHSRVTFLEQYEVPSGGDWAVHRGGAMYIQDSEGILISNCTFDQAGGNGVIFSNHVVASAITDCEFRYMGDSGIVLLGSTNGIDGSAPTYPNKNMIARNHIHEVGVYGKQTSCIAVQLSANSTITDNVCYNGPRAGFNWNDGFGGGNVFRGNAVWNMVRETGDHGPLNSWDRQPYWTFSGVNDGFNDSQGRSFLRAEDHMRRNLMINGYNGVWTFDRDDCSQFVTDEENFMVFGGCKNFIGDSKICRNNVILYPGISVRSAGNRRCQTDDNGEFANSYHIGNTCTSADGTFYSFAQCSADPNNLNSSVYITTNNTLYADPGTTFSQSCDQDLTFDQWQALGQDNGSTTSVTPPVATLLQLGAAVLGL